MPTTLPPLEVRQANAGVSIALRDLGILKEMVSLYEDFRETKSDALSDKIQKHHKPSDWNKPKEGALYQYDPISLSPIIV